MSCTKFRPKFHHCVVTKIHFLRWSNLRIYIPKSWSWNSGKDSSGTISIHPRRFCSTYRWTKLLKLVILITKQVNFLTICYIILESKIHHYKVSRSNLTFMSYGLLQSDSTSSFPNPRIGQMSDPEGWWEGGK